MIMIVIVIHDDQVDHMWNISQDVNQNFIGDECEKGEDFDKDGFIG